jgi:quinol monooxygenase YgiN
MYYLHGKFVAKEGKRDELAGILLEASKLVGRIEGCKLYVVAVSDKSSNDVYVTEMWDSKETQMVSLGDAEIKALIKRAVPLIESISDEDRLELSAIGGYGV